MIALGRDIAMFRPTVEAVVRGDPDALLIVEFAEEDQAENLRRLKQLDELMRDLGFGWDRPPRKWGGVVEVAEPALQAAIAEFRTAGLNVMMSMKQEGKPVSFIEDCAVPLPHLADYTDRLTAIFEKHGTKGTWYAHASEGCLHVRPVLNLKLDKDVKTDARHRGGSLRDGAGLQGLALRRARRWHRALRVPRADVRLAAGARLRAGEGRASIRTTLSIRARSSARRRMDDRSLFRYPPGYRVDDRTMALDWSAFPGAAGGFQGAVEMCNNNGACRKLQGGVMCPSYMATRNERDVTRGRANTLRLAISGQLGPDAFTSDGVMETLKLCVSCKGCRRECPTGVDMAKMKIEVLAARAEKYGLSFQRPSRRLPAPLRRERPRALAPLRQPAQPQPRLATADGAGRRHQRAPLAPRVAARRVRSARRRRSARRTAPRSCFSPIPSTAIYERENPDAALQVLTAGGYRVHLARPIEGGRPLCCGRTFLSAGLVGEARIELDRVVAALLRLSSRAACRSSGWSRAAF